MKCLIAIDGSPGGFEAVRQAGELLKGDRDRAVLFYVPPTIKLDGSEAVPEVMQRAKASLSAAIFDEARLLLPDGVRATAEIMLGAGSPKQSIVAAAKTCSADLIAVGARGLGMVERMLLGSVSTYVAFSSHVPVLVVRPRAATHAGQPLHVLVSCSSAVDDADVAQVIKQISWPADVQGFTVSVVQSMFAGHVPKWLEERARSEEVETMARAWVAEHAAEIASKRAELEGFDSNLPEGFRGSVPIVVEGHPAEKILETITARKIDVVVIGAHADSSVARFFLGSTSQAVLTQAPCSVLIVRHAVAV